MTSEITSGSEKWQNSQPLISMITRYEILRGLKARRATRQLARFEQRCQQSQVLPLTDAIIVLAADLYALLYQTGQLISRIFPPVLSKLFLITL